MQGNELMLHYERNCNFSGRSLEFIANTLNIVLNIGNSSANAWCFSEIKK